MRIEELSERRRYRRFRLRQPAFVVFDADPPKLREVLDIGMSGLAVSFVDDHAELREGTSRLTLISRIRGHQPEEDLGGLPCRIVSERAMDEFPPSRIHRRRCGIELVDLTPGQRQKLAGFILAHADEEV